MSKTQGTIDAKDLRIAALERTLSATKTDLGLADICARQEYELRKAAEKALDERNEALDAARKRIVELESFVLGLGGKLDTDRWRDWDVEEPPIEADDMIRVWGCCEDVGEPWQEIVLNKLAPFEREDWTFTHWRPLSAAPEVSNG